MVCFELFMYDRILKSILLLQFQLRCQALKNSCKSKLLTTLNMKNFIFELNPTPKAKTHQTMCTCTEYTLKGRIVSVTCTTISVKPISTGHHLLMSLPLYSCSGCPSQSLNSHPDLRSMSFSSNLVQNCHQFIQKFCYNSQCFCIVKYRTDLRLMPHNPNTKQNNGIPSLEQTTNALICSQDWTGLAEPQTKRRTVFFFSENAVGQEYCVVW